MVSDFISVIVLYHTGAKTYCMEHPHTEKVCAPGKEKNAKYKFSQALKDAKKSYKRK